MMSTAAAPRPGDSALSEPSRIINAFIAPGKTFTDLRRNSSWWAPWALISVVAVLFVYTIQIKVGIDQSVLNKMYATPLTGLIAFAVIAAVLMATFNLGAGTSIQFKTSLAVVTYGNLPTVIYSLLGILSLALGLNRGRFDIKDPVPTNAAHFLNPSANKFLYGMASALDVFVLWSIVLMAIGFAAVSKLKRSTTLFVTLAWYVVWKLATSGLAVLFS
jgi:Yip1 domain